MSPVLRLPVGVVVERRKAASPWIDYIWRPAAVLPRKPDAKAWTVLSQDDDGATFYAGEAEVELHHRDTASYRDNLLTGEPKLWVVLRPTGAEPPYTIVRVTADGSEGEGFTAAGDDLVDCVAMPDPIRREVEAFVAEYPAEDTFFKRRRDRANPEAMGRRRFGGEDQE